MKTLSRVERRPHRLLNIRNPRHLAQRLGVRLGLLRNLTSRLDLHYAPTRLVKKKDGRRTRRITAPRPTLKKVQRRINDVLLSDLWLPDTIHGYRPQRSPKTAVAPHAGRKFLLVLDIRDFYPSIPSRAVYKMFQKLGCSPDVSRLLTLLTTRDHCVPQGAPTSPALSNAYLRLSGVAARLEGLARKFALTITFFGDDIIISSERPFHGLTSQLANAVTASGLRLNTEKSTGVAGPRESHRALGTVTNSNASQIDVPRSYRRRIRALIRLCKRKGPNALKDYGITTKDPRAFLRGKIAFAVYINARNAHLIEELNTVAWRAPAPAFSEPA